MMRAVSCRPRPGKSILPHARPYAKKLPGTAFSAISFLFGFIFLAGYLPGIFCANAGTNSIGTQLAEYYLDPLDFTVWSDACVNQMAASFLQLLFILLCGVSAFGIGFLVIFFFIKGAFLGFCAVNVLTLGGGSALAFYWLCVCLPNVLLLFLCLWLAGYAARLSIHLFQSVFGGGAPRGQLESARRRLLVRAGIALLSSCLLCFLCSGFTSCIARLLF